jgi:hypothetical protein
VTSTTRYWIQKADFSAEEFASATASEAIDIIHHHDWNRELALRFEREAAGKEFCDPGIGFIASDGRILHICPVNDRSAYFHYHFPVSTKILGLIPRTRQVTSSNMSIQQERLSEVVEKFFQGDHDWLLSHSSISR